MSTLTFTNANANGDEQLESSIPIISGMITISYNDEIFLLQYSSDIVEKALAKLMSTNEKESILLNSSNINLNINSNNKLAIPKDLTTWQGMIPIFQKD